MLYIIFSVHP